MADKALTVRVATLADLPAVDAMLSRSYPKLLKADYPPSVLVTALPLISRAQPDLLNSGTYYLAVFPADGIVGAGGWTPDRRFQQLGHVRHVITDDRHVRRGIGRAVLARVLDEARSAGIRRLNCNATWTAEPFYQAMGFHSIGPIQLSLAPGIAFPAIRMEQVL